MPAPSYSLKSVNPIDNINLMIGSIPTANNKVDIGYTLDAVTGHGKLVIRATISDPGEALALAQEVRTLLNL